MALMLDWMTSAEAISKTLEVKRWCRLLLSRLMCVFMSTPPQSALATALRVKG